MHSERYARQTQLPGFGVESQKKLAAAKVLVVGAGGLGVPVLQYLTGMGVGTIGIVDGDVVSLSNLHRQVLYSTADIGQPKVEIAAAKLAALNPEISLRSYAESLSPSNALRLIADYDIVVDATDNFSARYLINDACVMLTKPFVYGAVHQFEGHVSVFNLGAGPTYRCLYPSPPSAGETPDCNTAGVLGVVPGIIGCRQALEVVKVITEIGKNLSGTLQIFDFLNGREYQLKLAARPENKIIHALQEVYGEAACSSYSTLLSPQEWVQWQSGANSFTLLDVREPDEFSSGHLPGAHNIPLSKLSSKMPVLDVDLPLVVYCQQGGRSAQAAALLSQQQPTLRLFEIAGGLDNIQRHGKP